MTQILAILTRHGSLQREIPDPDQQVMSGVRWGHADEFPAAAYWLQRALTWRLEQEAPARRSNRTLAEEVGAWLLGGQGVTAAVAQAAFDRLRMQGAFARPGVTEAAFAAWLSEPLDVGGQPVAYRLAAQRAKYLATTMPALIEGPGARDGRELRDWLMTLPGLGPKSASGIVRQWSGATDVALLDNYVLRVGQVMGLFGRKLTVERHYLEMEARFLQLCKAMNVGAPDVEAVMALELIRSPETARFLADYLKATEPKAKAAPAPTPARRGQAPEQLSLVFTG
ncbi:hypothetical protein SAMN05216359_106257 [Roseateles sp. YR242]|uniref:8-oxoguanine DNA glycosylase n=1 Tax=Roseateles sp. YR242 TaxID=1855305 RepID=UPI0008D48CB2|nr:hypothetical protein [Roseateles sp. YR242]SEL23294.1 hypothetical protein SAMN05216359_106257 [Roseateles sp. YR242]